MSIRAIVVDDSALMRKMISDILNSDPDIEVISTAFNGKDAVDKTSKLKPDIITMDVEMPVMNGIDAVRTIMQENPTPILMVSALTEKGADITLESLQAGAIDFVCKPSGSISTNINEIGKEILEKVKNVAKAQISPIQKDISDGKVKEFSGSKIKTLLVDDSSFFIKTTEDILKKHPDIQIIGEANNGIEALKIFKQEKPDVILMDLEMPEMNGVEATHKILKEHFVPIIIFSSETANDMRDVKTALELGAIDFIAKPAKGTSMRSISQLLVQKIRDANKEQKNKNLKNIDPSDKIILIGTSTGGPQTLTELIPNIPSDISAGILIVQHMPPVFTKTLAERLDSISQISVREAKEGDEIKPGLALIAPGDYHMELKEKKINDETKIIVTLNQNDRIHGVRPAVDVTFSSAVNIYGSNTVAVILTGMGQDGANSMGLIKAKGGYTIAQDENTSIIFGMPQAAIKLGVIEKILPLDLIPAHIVKMLDIENRGKG